MNSIEYKVYICISMKSGISILLSFILFLASFQNSLFFIDYQLNKEYYQSFCVNKQRPELLCNGKCVVKKESEKQNSPLSEIKYSFELNILPAASPQVEFIKTKRFNEQRKVFSELINVTLEGYFVVQKAPPQILS